MAKYKIFETNQFMKDLSQDFEGQGNKVKNKLLEYTYPQLKENPYFGKNVKKLKITDMILGVIESASTDFPHTAFLFDILLISRYIKIVIVYSQLKQDHKNKLLFSIKHCKMKHTCLQDQHKKE